MANKEQIDSVGKPVNLSSELQKQALRKKVCFIIGLTAIFIGFFLLTLTNPEGNNWASILSPILIIGGYIVVIIALLMKP
ncbi:MAG: hypothetical protein N3A72_07525 [bacterium]|nr:hypothetical protein [bacterium]